MNLSHCHDLDDLRKLAARRLPVPVLGYLEGGAEQEIALARATAAFDECNLVPRQLRGTGKVSLSTQLFGKTIPFPLMLSPTGLTRLFHRDAEPAVARAASAAGLPYALSTVGTMTIEDFGLAQTGPRLFQVYIFKDRGLTAEMVERAKAAGMDGLVLTVDTPVAGMRKRDLVNGLKLPPKLTLRGFAGFAAKPRWSIPALIGMKLEFANLKDKSAALDGKHHTLHDYVASQFDPTLNWKDLDWLCSTWNGPVAVKGILAPEDALAAIDSGADTIMVSNHGGRQLETAVSPFKQIAPIADAIGGRARIICDGGVRNGRSIFKAIAMGADACSIGRGYLYGLAAGGEAGVARAISILREELERTMILAGATDIADIDRRFISPA